MRFRPSHFPFTEPSAEVDIGYKIENKKLLLAKEINGLRFWMRDGSSKCFKKSKVDPKKISRFCIWNGYKIV